MSNTGSVEALPDELAPRLKRAANEPAPGKTVKAQMRAQPARRGAAAGACPVLTETPEEEDLWNNLPI